MSLRVMDVSADVGRRLGMCATDPRVLGYINKAQEELFYEGKFVNTMTRYEVVQNQGILTLPRQLETIEVLAYNGRPANVRNGWYEFFGYGMGLISENSTLRAATDREDVCSIKELSGAVTSKIRVYTDVTETAGAKITLQGFNENNEWIRTDLGGGNWIDGELVALTAGPIITTNFFTSLTNVQKPLTNGNVRIFEYDTVNAVNLDLIGVYEPDELVPTYRRYLITGIKDSTTVTIYGKRRFIPARNQTDYLIIPNLNAIEDMSYARYLLANNGEKRAETYRQNALRSVQNQLKSYQGSGVLRTVKFQDRNTFGAGATHNIG